MEKSYSNGLLVGDNTGRFNPDKSLTRAEVAAVFCRVMNYSQRPEVVVKDPGTLDPGTTPARFIGEELGATVIWDKDKKTAIFELSNYFLNYQ